eukprot:9498621-Pyramimonas_sp.AAC.1
MALFGVFRVKPRGAFWSSPECKTWLNMRMGHTRRELAYLCEAGKDERQGCAPAKARGACAR